MREGGRGTEIELEQKKGGRDKQRERERERGTEMEKREEGEKETEADAEKDRGIKDSGERWLGLADSWSLGVQITGPAGDQAMGASAQWTSLRALTLGK